MKKTPEYAAGKRDPRNPPSAAEARVEAKVERKDKEREEDEI